MIRSLTSFLTAAIACAIVAPVFAKEVPRAEPPFSCDDIKVNATPPAVLVIDQPCVVPASADPYRFNAVNIVNSGALIFDDANGEITFWASSIIVENGGKLQIGTPDKPIGTTKGKVTIYLYGRPTPKGAPGVFCKSQPRNAEDINETCGAPLEIWGANVDSHADGYHPKPTTDVKKVKDLPISDAMKAAYPGTTDDYFYGYHPMFDDDGHKNAYFGTKVLGVSYGGTLEMFGKKGAIYTTLPADKDCKPTGPGSAQSTGRSWVRLAKTAPEKEKTDQITVVTPDCGLDWGDGDTIVVTTTDYLASHSEERTISGTPKDNHDGTTTITLSSALTFVHNGERYYQKDLTADEQTRLGKGGLGLRWDLSKESTGVETRAAVGLLTRSIRIVSGGCEFPEKLPAAGTKCKTPTGSNDDAYFGGHTVFRQGFKAVHIQGVEFYQMGQGGRLGHYPVHFHHARKTQKDGAVGSYVLDSSIWDSMTRWIVLHGTSDVTLARNVGYKSIGHGFYLEDGTEINNKLLANLGVLARAAVDNPQNDRKVPGILAAPDAIHTSDEVAFFPTKSDVATPSVFWIMNGWNDFQFNMAAGAGTCGACYWLVPGANSTMSRDMKWESYASMQSSLARAGMTPVLSFIGNSCTSAMTALQTVGGTSNCQGVGGPEAPMLSAIPNPRAPNHDDLNYYPTADKGGGRFATECNDADCSKQPDRCGEGTAGACRVTVIDRFTTSFNYASTNFAAVWLRPQWYLVTDSAITDSQQAGLTIVTGGGYTKSDAPTGHWAVVRKSVFIGQTQEGNPYSSNGGPAGPGSQFQCDKQADGHRPGDRCVSVKDGFVYNFNSFGMYQRLFSVYDGPAYQELNAYLNIKKRVIDDCSFVYDEANRVGKCAPKDPTKESAWIAGIIDGLPKDEDGKCYMPNAAIGWKQPNGFYYPPAFHSKDLFFKGVDTRHFVVAPPFLHEAEVDWPRVRREYCKFSEKPAHTFSSFNSIDRQTVLNDTDGSLTGFKNTTVTNNDDFFAGPVGALQCKSANSSRTMPYEYVTTVVRSACTNGDCKNWDVDCSLPTCYGVPLWRQQLMPKADGGQERSIQMMGQAIGQRSTLTVNHGVYYMDTSVDLDTQTKNCTTPPCRTNVFAPNETYYTFLLFGRSNTEQTYRFWVGPGPHTSPEADDPVKYLKLQLLQANIDKATPTYLPKLDFPSGIASWVDRTHGVVQLVLKMTDVVPDWNAKLPAAKAARCQPATYCHWNGSACVDGSGDSGVCSWAVVEPFDCPQGGCPGFKFTLPASFRTRLPGEPDPRPPPDVCVPRTSAFNIPLSTPLDSVAGDCKPAPAPVEDFCP